MSNPIFVTGIGTDVGKTVVSAILTEALQADYWKPVQAGDLDNSDTIKVKRLVSNPITKFHPEAYALTQPFSPHKSADLDGVDIDIDHFQLPQTDNQLLIEGAGGLMVPLNNKHLVIDLIPKLNADAVLVSRNYLGSINHTLLSIEALKSRGINIKAIIFNGDADEYTESIIQAHVGSTISFYHIPNLPAIDREEIARQALKLKDAGIQNLIN
ncbi:dethiobiotin synthase [Mucilaginibacter myungsuensis]|uniref:ATP-dependent dethiobiotin synthetase BioD n=1 Tax=Mucilaginibacter myungsuensis TaxID=649104 RepID=A0A929L103_9SPHI|nr:dethiobiotin synthase [Mucilaginibacter myungsuensis]MBE9662130.1 dethiobiotin synthase [Mucilaginibacter myungsuensis]MDN3599436.1 dethiobiotin synthase [Mucilaginibacter myungsuensis]